MDLELSIGNGATLREGGGATLGTIDQYELVRELGGGGFGTVFLARDTVAGIDVAVKGLPPLVKNNREELENIRRNFALVSRLHHPHVAAALVLHPATKVAYSDRAVAEKLRVFEGDFLVVMEYAPGVTLSRWRKQFDGGRVPPEQALAIVRQVADALDYAHAQKIIHRDVKPANVMVETKEDGSLVARVLDFGLAAEVRSSMGRVSQQVTDKSGTRPYMAPEQWLGKRQGAATDQYALAVLAHELLTGEVPFASVFETGDPVVMMNVVEQRAVEIPGSQPSAFRKALERALEKDPARRFPSCAAFASALSEPGGAYPIASAGRFGKPLFYLAAVAVAVVALALLLSRKESPRPQAEPEEFDSAPVPVEPPDDRVPPPSNYWHDVADVPTGPSRNVPAAAPKLPPLTEGCTVSVGKVTADAVYRPAKGLSQLRAAVDEAIRARAGLVTLSPAEECASAKVSAEGYATEIASALDRLRDGHVPWRYVRGSWTVRGVRELDERAMRECKNKPVPVQ